MYSNSHDYCRYIRLNPVAISNARIQNLDSIFSNETLNYVKLFLFFFRFLWLNFQRALKPINATYRVARILPNSINRDIFIGFGYTWGGNRNRQKLKILWGRGAENTDVS